MDSCFLDCFILDFIVIIKKNTDTRCEFLYRADNVIKYSLFSQYLLIELSLKSEAPLKYLVIINRDFPGGPVVKTPNSQCRGPGFDPRSGNYQ